MKYVCVIARSINHDVPTLLYAFGSGEERMNSTINYLRSKQYNYPPVSDLSCLISSKWTVDHEAQYRTVPSSNAFYFKIKCSDWNSVCVFIFIPRWIKITSWKVTINYKFWILFWACYFNTMCLTMFKPRSDHYK